MSDNANFEYPKANEKLSYKFILDSLKEEMLWKDSPEAVGIETPPTEVTLTTGTEIEGLVEEPKTEELSGEPMIDESAPTKELVLAPGKKYFRIGEVSELIGVEAYVLRYWESEFPVVRPTKAGSGHRVYSRKDVEALYQIRQLLHVEKFSIKGAKKKLLEKKKEHKELVQKQEPDYRLLKEFAQDIKELISLAKAGI